MKTTAQCRTCKIDKPAIQFYMQSAGTKRRTQCKACELIVAQRRNANERRRYIDQHPRELSISSTALFEVWR